MRRRYPPISGTTLAAVLLAVTAGCAAPKPMDLSHEDDIVRGGMIGSCYLLKRPADLLPARDPDPLPTLVPRDAGSTPWRDAIESFPVGTRFHITRVERQFIGFWFMYRGVDVTVGRIETGGQQSIDVDVTHFVVAEPPIRRPLLLENAVERCPADGPR